MPKICESNSQFSRFGYYLSIETSQSGSNLTLRVTKISKSHLFPYNPSSFCIMNECVAGCWLFLFHFHVCSSSYLLWHVWFVVVFACNKLFIVHFIIHLEIFKYYTTTILNYLFFLHILGIIKSTKFQYLYDLNKVSFSSHFILFLKT